VSGYDPATIEPRWQAAWRDAAAFDAEIDEAKPKFYCLEMFPYPSGHMHMGHVRNYSIGDAMARFHRLTGHTVLYPMGYDSFGMPAENAARKDGGHPHDVTWANIESIRNDLLSMGFSYDWRRELATSDASYYHWNQWILLRFHEMGLVERREAPVNWCDSCDTVLANEQVRNNRCWRCAGEVRQKDMAQWFLRMTEYADELLDDLDWIGFPENVKMMQRNWIGRSHGATIRFPVVGEEEVIETFTTRPDTIFGVTFVTLAPEHPLCERLVAGNEHEDAYRALAEECARMSEFDRVNMLREKKGVPLGRNAVNPLTGEEVPIFAGNFVVASYGTGAVMAVPGHDQRDHDFAKRYDIPIRPVLTRTERGVAIDEDPVFDGLGWMVNSGRPGFDGLYGDDAKQAVIAALEGEGTGGGTIEYRLKDWLLSRQRFWGTPIPFIHCGLCGVVPVPTEDLPVTLPLDVSLSEDESGNPLSSHASFTDVECPSCGSDARRETDTMDTFYDSSWYFLRFCDAMNNEEPFDRGVADHWMDGGVDLYIGGIEHAIMHLLYARFFTKALRDAGLTSVSEPFSRLVCQGMVNAPAPFCPSCSLEVHVDGASDPCPGCGGALSNRSAKMSKSLGNTVSPVEMIDRYGADTVRLFILFAANPEAGMDWSDTEIEAKNRQMRSLHAAFCDEDGRSSSRGDSEHCLMDSWLMARLRANRSAWRAAMTDVSLREGVMISHNQMLDDWNWAMRRGGVSADVGREVRLGWAPMLAPATPHLAEEIWADCGGEGMLASATIDVMEPNENDAAVLAREAFLRNAIDRARNVKQLAERHADGVLSELVIFTAPEWKRGLVRTALRLHAEEFDFRQGGQKVLQAQACFHDEATKGDAVNVWRGLVTGSKKRRGRIHTLSEGERLLIQGAFDEVEWLRSNSSFIAEALGVPAVSIAVSGEVEDVAGKSSSARPLLPGLAYR